VQPGQEGLVGSVDELVIGTQVSFVLKTR
jgi:hypothetical protein